MAIAYDNATHYSGSYNNYPVSHTTGSLTDGAMISMVQISNNNTLTSCTYNGVPLTTLFSYDFAGSVFKNTYFVYLINPSSGANNFDVDVSSTATYVYSEIGTYSGVDQTNPFGSTPVYSDGTPATDTTHTEAITTNVDNAWLVGFAQANNTFVTAGANTTRRTNDNWGALIDSNAPQTPVGSYSLQVTASSARHNIILAQVAPAATSSTTIKTYLGVTTANVKTVLNGTAIASRKTWNGIA